MPPKKKAVRSRRAAPRAKTTGARRAATPSKRVTTGSKRATTGARRTATRTAARTKKAPARRARPDEPLEIPWTEPLRSGPPREDARQEPAHEAAPHSSFHPGFSAECLACPICLVFYGIRQTRPEAMEHVMRAAFELFAAFKAVTDSYSDRWEQAQKLQHIPIA